MHSRRRNNLSPLVLFSSNEDGDPEPQKRQNGGPRRWEDPPGFTTATQTAPDATFRTAVVQWLMRYKQSAFGETAPQAQDQTKDAVQGEVKVQAKEEYLVVAPSARTWDPAVVSDPVAAAKAVTAEELEDARLLQLLLQKRDEELNVLAWKCLGYRYINYGAGYAWDTTYVFPKWRQRYPIPPDLVGVSGDTPETIAAVEFLASTTAEKYQDAVERHCKSQGLRYIGKQVNPAATRKVQVTQWLMFYRDEYFGVPMEELQRRKQQQQQAHKKEWMHLMQQRANSLGVSLEDMLEREEKKKRRQKLEKLRQQRERGTSPRSSSPT